MLQKKLWFTMSGVLTILVMTLMLQARAEAATKYKVLYRFTGGADGAGPEFGSLISDAAGNLYGTTYLGGETSNCSGAGGGVVFELMPNGDGSWTDKVLYAFTGGTDGGSPQQGLIFDAAGNLYGTTYSGGLKELACDEFGCGVAFKLAPNQDGSWTQSVLHSFAGSTQGDGAQPTSGLIFDAVGNLYGETGFGGCAGPGGTVFNLTPNSDGTWTEHLLSGCPGGGQHPGGGLTFDTAGNLYGTALNSDFPECGLVFELTPNGHGGWTDRAIHVFSCTDGNKPSGGLTLDADGNLYGTTSGGNGLVFELSPTSNGRWAEKVIHRFANHPAATPFAGVIFDPAGNLYGTTVSGGPVGGGTVFKLTPNADGRWRESVPHIFQGKPAASPYAGLLLDKAGNLYGTTFSCGSGAGCAGVVFEITP
jgi:uncharacterized repeat protein (TIGR03803 family)